MFVGELNVFFREAEPNWFV